MEATSRALSCAKRLHRIFMGCNSRLQGDKNPDQVFAVALRTAVGIQLVAVDEALVESSVVPIVNMSALVVIKQAHRHSRGERHDQTGGHRADPVGHRREAATNYWKVLGKDQR